MILSFLRSIINQDRRIPTKNDILTEYSGWNTRCELKVPKMGMLLIFANPNNNLSWLEFEWCIKKDVKHI